MKTPIYLDYQATTPMDPAVLEAMMPYFTEEFGNAASASHRFGLLADQAVEKARRQIASALGVLAKDVVFTSGASESNNLCLKGVIDNCPNGHIITSAIEHKSILDTCAYLEERGTKVTYLPVNEFGQVTAESVASAITDDTVLVSIMFANNEIGTVNDVYQIGEVCSKHNVAFHSDASQALAFLPIDARKMQITFLSCSGHKCYGPKGIGVFVRNDQQKTIPITPLVHGGGHERGLRSGTLNVPGIVGFGKAAALCTERAAKDSEKLRTFAQSIFSKLKSRFPEIELNGHPSKRLPNNLSLTFPGINAASLADAVPELAFSAGSACNTRDTGPSHVLCALGLPLEKAKSTIRLGLGRYTTKEQVDFAVDKIANAVDQLLRR